MQLDLLEAGSHEEDGLFDFVVKERISRAFASRQEGIKVSFGEPMNEVGASLFHIPLSQLSNDYEQFHSFFRDFTTDDIYDYECEFKDLDMSLFSLVGLFNSGAFKWQGGAIRPDEKMTDECIITWIQQAYYPDMDDDEIPLVLDFKDSYANYLKGDTEGAFRSRIFTSYCERLAYVFSPGGVYKDIPKEYAADHMMDMVCAFGEATEDASERYIMYCTKETVLLDKYFDLLTDDEKDAVMTYLPVFKNPVSSLDSECCCERYGDYDVVTVTSHMNPFELTYTDDEVDERTIEASNEFRDFNIFFEASVKWLFANLPLLREKYLGNGE